MRLKRLWVNGFKNLNDFELDFSDKDGITVLIGNNGSGKSNVLEAISAIFSDLYNIDNARRKKVDFSYKIEYQIENKNVIINVVYENENVDYYASLDDKKYDDLKQSPLKEFLPSNLLMIYSGEDLSIQKKYYEPFRNKFQREIRNIQTIPSLPKMLYIDSFFWTISLLSLLKSDNPDDEKFCKAILKSDTLANIEILFAFNSHLITQELFSLGALYDENEERILSLDDFNSIEPLPNEKDLFVQLTGMVGQRNKIKKLTITNNGVDTQFLSEGEKKQILIRSALSFLADENSLVLFDEPDANIHVSNKGQIKTMLEEYSNRENILTTHSPTLTHAFDEKHVTMINDGQIEDKTKQEVFSHITDGIWNYQEQSVFLSSTKDIILLVEGKHDKIHIEEAFRRLKDDYEELAFDIFSVDGADNINQLLIGIKSSYEMFDSSKKYIGLFDCDDKGRRIASNAKRKKYASLKGSRKFYYMFLPFENYEKDFEIENMYPEPKLQEAYKKAIDIVTTNINKNTIEKEAKNQLSILCRDFNENNEDFDKFKDLFNLIKKIKELP